MRKMSPFWRFYFGFVALCLVLILVAAVWLARALTRYQAEENRRLAAPTASVTPAHGTTPAPATETPAPTATPEPPTPTPEPTATPTPDSYWAPYTDAVRAVSDDIAAFIAGRKEFWQIEHHLAPGTDTADRLRNFVNIYYFTMDSYSLDDWKVYDWEQTGADITCTVYYMLHAYQDGVLSASDEMAYRMTFRVEDGRIRIYSIELR